MHDKRRLNGKQGEPSPSQSLWGRCGRGREGVCIALPTWDAVHLLIIGMYNRTPAASGWMYERLWQARPPWSSLLQECVPRPVKIPNFNSDRKCLTRKVIILSIITVTNSLDNT